MGCRGQPTCYRCKDCRGPNFKRPVEVTTIRTKRGADKKQGKLRAFKVLRKESYYSSGRTRRSWRGPYYDYRYIVGKIAKELYPDRSTCRACGVGINVSTLSDSSGYFSIKVLCMSGRSVFLNSPDWISQPFLQ